MSKRIERLEPLLGNPKRRQVPTAGIDVLYVDILALIFDYAPVRARLCAISFVCKKWRTAALRSVMSISYPLCSAPTREQLSVDRPSKIAQALGIFPSLTSLYLTEKYGTASEVELMLPTTLRHLHISKYYLHILVRSTAAVTQRSPCILDAYFARLTSLSLETEVQYMAAASWGHFMSQHSTQLTSLRVRCVDFYHGPQWVIRHTFPELVHLEIHCKHLETTSFEAMLRHSTKLQSLRLRTQYEVIGNILPLLTALVELELDDQYLDALGLLKVIEPLTRLRYLTCPSLPLPHLRREMDNSAPWIRVSETTNLQLLKVTIQKSIAPPFDPIPLPYLKTLIVSSSTIPKACKVVRLFMSVAPLQRIELAFHTAAARTPLLLELLHDAMMRGVVHVTLVNVRRDQWEDIEFISNGWMDLVCESPQFALYVPK